jgi:hypothetical protein
MEIGIYTFVEKQHRTLLRENSIDPQQRMRDLMEGNDWQISWVLKCLELGNTTREEYLIFHTAVVLAAAAAKN